MEPRGLWPWDIVAICGVLVVAAYVVGSTSHSEEAPQIQSEEKPDWTRDAEIDDPNASLKSKTALFTSKAA